jgi:hypothetical protein
MPVLFMDFIKEDARPTRNAMPTTQTLFMATAMVR